MANRRFNQFMYTMHAMPVVLDCNIAIGSTGAVGTTNGPGIKAVTRLAAGVYDVQFQDNYYKYYLGQWQCSSPVTGSEIADGSFVATTLYQISTVGTTTDWAAVGLPAGVTAAVGAAFVATGIGGAGNGKVKALTTSGIFKVEAAGNPNLELAPSGPSNQGGHMIIRTLNASGANTDPTSGCVLFLSFYLSNSSVVISGG